MAQPVQPIRGMHDILPEEGLRHAHVVETAREVARLYGYRTIATPIVEPSAVFQLTLGDTQLTLLGTAHVSRASAEAVAAELEHGDYDAVAVELCPSRYHAIVDPDAMARMDLFHVLREGKGTMVIASLALGAYQQRLAEQFGIEPGAEMRAAVDHARAHHKPVWLIDREVGTTLKRVYRGMPWWRRFELLSSLLASVVSSEKVEEAEIERIKEGDMLESAFAQFADQERELFQALIVERDRYMAARLLHEIETARPRNVLVVLGAGHLRVTPAPERPVAQPPDAEEGDQHGMRRNGCECLRGAKAGNQHPPPAAVLPPAQHAVECKQQAERAQRFAKELIGIGPGNRRQPEEEAEHHARAVAVPEPQRREPQQRRRQRGDDAVP